MLFVSGWKLLTIWNNPDIFGKGRLVPGRNPSMVKIERLPGQAVVIGPYTLWVLSVHGDEVVLALHDPDKDCAPCGERPADHFQCPICQAEAIVCPSCIRLWRCPNCASPLG